MATKAEPKPEKKNTVPGVVVKNGKVYRTEIPVKDKKKK